MWSDLPDTESPFFDQDIRKLRRQLMRQEIGSCGLKFELASEALQYTYALSHFCDS